MAAKRTRRLSVATISLLTAVTLSLTACTDGPFVAGDDAANTVTADLASNIDTAVANAMQLSGSTAAIVGVWTSSGEYVTAYGEDVTAGSPIRAAQASQPVMCALLLDLVTDGTLKLDRKVSADLPRQVGLEDITYRQLCEATSGLADFKSANLRDVFINNPTRPWSDRELLAQSLAHSPLAEPGAAQQVADTNALVLARALKQVTGESMSNLLERHVFTPAAMRASSYPTDVLTQVELPENGMTGLTYVSSGGAPVCTVPGEEEGTTVPAEPVAVTQVSPSILGGAGATVTTVSDLKRFYESYLSGAFGNEEATELVTTLSVPPPPEPEEGAEPAEAPAEEVEPVTDGWTFGLEKQSSLYGMSGAITGTLTASYHDPASGLTVVIALNNSSAGSAFVRALAFELAALAQADLSWTAEDQAARLSELAVCQPAPEAAEATE